jgi:nitrate/nitrite transporter NarK
LRKLFEGGAHERSGVRDGREEVSRQAVHRDHVVPGHHGQLCRPRHEEAGGVSGGLFNTFGNLSSITTPIVIGYILAATGSFNGALVFVGLNALVAAFAYLFIVGEIKRVQLKAA